jgi:hypothetical protein
LATHELLDKVVERGVEALPERGAKRLAVV